MILFDLLAHPCGYVRRVRLLQQLFCFCIKHHRVPERLLPAMQRYIKIRQNFVHTNERYACCCNNLYNGRFLFVKFDNVFFRLCHLYFVLMAPTEQVSAVISLNLRYC